MKLIYHSTVPLTLLKLTIVWGKIRSSRVWLCTIRYLGGGDSETDRPTLTDQHKHTCHVMRVMTCVCLCKMKMSSKPGCHYRYTPTTL